MVGDALSFGQRRDATGQIQPWLTHGALDEISSWALADKRVLEWGAGHSTLWWALRCLEVHAIESSPEWVSWVCKNALPTKTRTCVYYRPAEDPNYPRVPTGLRPDIVVVDGAQRTNCILEALTLSRPFTLIVDNWQQDFVYRCAVSAAAMEPFRERGRFYVQADHMNHEGRPWQTAIWNL